MRRPTFSLIVPTRGRVAQLRCFLNSIARTTKRPECLEILLIIDADDAVTVAASLPELNVKRVIGPPGRTMGELNRAGYQASSGDFAMLLNDDVIARTRGWDEVALKQFRRFPDPLVLVHVNDLLISHHLCVFPLVSRAYCELAGGICPTDYRRYRIDDHIEDPFNMLAHLGVRRTVYLPDVIFEHTNSVADAHGNRVYQSDAAILDDDAKRFDEKFVERRELALRMLDAIDPRADLITARERLNGVRDSFSIRTEGRQWIERLSVWNRMKYRYEREGVRGVTRSLTRRVRA